MSNFGNGIDWNPGGMSGTVKFGDDKNLLVMFYNKAVENASLSLQAGRRICENKIYVRIQHPGENFNVIDRPVKDEDKMRFRDHWSKFLLNKTQLPEGTPIDLLFPNNPAFAENLRANGIHTIDQCASLSASAIDTLGRGGQDCVNRAKAYLENATKGADFHKWKEKEKEWEQKYKLQEQQIEDLKNRLEAYLQRQLNPQQASLSPGFITGYDAQSERINANHKTTEIAKSKKPVVIDAVPAEAMFPNEFASDLSK